MLVLLSPAKSLDFESPVRLRRHSNPRFLKQAGQLMQKLRKLKPAQVSSLMKISAPLGQLNYDRFQVWQMEHQLQSARTKAEATSRQAMLAFQGDVYQGLRAAEFNASDRQYAQQHLRILSGLYGLLRPLDLIQPYRLEMGTQLKNGHGTNLYDFWDEQLGQQILKDAQACGTSVVVNLASVEYSRAARPADLQASGLRVIQPVFQDFSKGQFKIISFFAKQARGMLARFILQRRIKDPQQLSDFKEAGYVYDAERSTVAAPVFRRRQD